MITGKRKKTIIAVAAVATLGLGGAAVAGATGGGGDDDATDKPIQGAALDRAKQVALDHIGDGKVTGTEVGDEEGAYEVEVTRADGSQVDVHLDKGFHVINSAADGAKGEDDGGSDSGNDD